VHVAALSALRRALHEVRRAHRHVTRANASALAALAVLTGLVVVGSLQFAAGSTRQPLAAPEPLPASAAPVTPAVSQPIVLPRLPKLRSLIPATVLLTSARPLTDDVVRRVVSLTGANASLRVAAGQVDLGRGTTRVLATDPVKMRVWTPAVTGRATGVWQRSVIGEAVVAHAVARADGVRLGGALVVQRGTASIRLRVGAFATTQLPGVGLVLNTALGNRLGLLPGTGLLLAVPAADPAVITAVLGHALGAGVLVEPVLSSQAQAGSWAPPAIGPITSPFGMRIHPITHQPQFHEGIDIGAPLGAPVYAMSDGQVLYAGPASGFGDEIVLSHAGGVSTIYGHVSQLFVTSGSVKAGQVIALVGSEGESTGPHLHAEVHVQDRPVDPVAWLSDHGVQFTR
jgi:hypothetical protein